MQQTEPYHLFCLLYLYGSIESKRKSSIFTVH